MEGSNDGEGGTLKMEVVMVPEESMVEFIDGSEVINGVNNIISIKLERNFSFDYEQGG